MYKNLTYVTTDFGCHICQIFTLKYGIKFFECCQTKSKMFLFQIQYLYICQISLDQIFRNN